LNKFNIRLKLKIDAIKTLNKLQSLWVFKTKWNPFSYTRH